MSNRLGYELKKCPELQTQDSFRDLELDADVIKKIQEIQKLPEKDRDHLFYVVVP